MEKYIFNCLKTHLFIEYYYRPGKMHIREELIKGTELLFEQYGVYKTCEQDAKRIIGEIESYPNTKEFYVPLFNGFIDVVHVVNKTEMETSSSEYVPLESIMENGRFKEITINVKFEKGISLGVIMHELTHAYQDYNLRSNNKSLYGELEKSNYFKQVLKNYLNKDETRVVFVLKFLNDFERGAYIPQIEGDLRSCDKKCFNTVSDVMDFIKETITYKNYSLVFNVVKHFNNIEDINRQNKILIYVKNYTNYNFALYSDFIKWLKNKSNKCQYKFENTLPKLACRFIRIDEVLSPNPNVYMRDILNIF